MIEKHLILGSKHLSADYFCEISIALNLIYTLPRAMPPGIAGDGNIDLNN